jgi:outer membrane immunogenic protein
MRKLGIVFASIFFISASAHAADYRTVNKTYGPFFQWSGLYIGGHIGGAWSDADWTFFNGAVTESFSQRQSRGIGGGQIGVQFQWDTLVIGLEGSYSENLSDSCATSVALLAADRARDSRVSDLFLLTPRIGFAWGPMLVYGKAGYATADVDFRGFVSSTGVVTSTSSGREHGWTAGAGLEYALWQNLVLGPQYDYVNLDVGDRAFAVTPGFAGPNTGTDIDVSTHLVTARLSLLFNPW